MDTEDIPLSKNLVDLREAPSLGPSEHTIQRRQERIQELEAEQGQIMALIEDLRRISTHIDTAQVVGTKAIPLVQRKLRDLRSELGTYHVANRRELEMLRSRV